jgi:hypothetical protein
MATEYRVLVSDTSPDAPASPELSLQSLRDAVLAHPTLALDALRYAMQSEGGESSSIGGALPMDAPIYKLLTADQAKLLTPAAAKLTKADLLKLQGLKGVKLSDMNLTFDDVKTIEAAFHQGFEVSGLAKTGDDGTVACCCCAPCCCCCGASVPPPVLVS